MLVFCHSFVFENCIEYTANISKISVNGNRASGNRVMRGLGVQFKKQKWLRNRVEMFLTSTSTLGPKEAEKVFENSQYHYSDWYSYGILLQVKKAFCYQKLF